MEDIVTKPPGGRCDVLVNPGNEELVGTSRHSLCHVKDDIVTWKRFKGGGPWKPILSGPAPLPWSTKEEP
eukprot:513415-Amphidinium_carterae.2